MSGGFNDVTTYSADPGTGSYGILQSQAENAYSTAVNSINSNRTSLLRQSGVTGQYDSATGNFLGAGDPNGLDHTGSYWGMSDANAGQGAQDDAAIGSLGFSGGVANQMHEQADQGYSKNATDWATQLFNGLHDLSGQDIQATQTAGDTLYNWLVQNITDAINAGNFNPADYTNVNMPGYGSLSADDINALATGLGWSPTSSGGSSAPVGVGSLAGGGRQNVGGGNGGGGNGGGGRHHRAGRRNR